MTSVTDLFTMPSPSLATARVSFAAPAILFTFCAISIIVCAISSAAVATWEDLFSCSVERVDICPASTFNSWPAEATLSDACFTFATTSLHFSIIFFMAESNCPISSFLCVSIRMLRSPSASLFATGMSCVRGFIIFFIKPKRRKLMATIRHTAMILITKMIRLKVAK
ncbi:MAG: hypothetical protein A4E64_00500 [Syntrophorhabdus sp. PtaU1.Bin058]|nr:MAG: hypothetical protein A4E64_00500 [Syntrophorhabdus sp. PtaU1.Bin058]